MNKYILKEKKISSIVLLQEISVAEEIYQFPEDYLIIATGYVDKLRELGFVLQGNNYFMVRFTRQVPHGEIIFENERKWDQDSKGKQEVHAGVDPAIFNSLTEDNKRKFIINIIAQVLREYLEKYNRNADLVNKVESLILKFGRDLEVIYKVKETKKYKLVISYQIKSHQDANAIIGFTYKVNGDTQKVEIPIHWFDDIDHLISSIKIKNSRIEIGPGKMRELNDLLNQWDPIGVLPYEEGPKDEYYCFIDPIMKVLQTSKKKEDIVEVLEFHLKNHFEYPIPSNIESFAKDVIEWNNYG